MSFIKRLILLIVIGVFSIACQQQNEEISWKPADGYIPNESSATKMAEIVWLNIYGKSVEDNKPYKVKLIDNKIWAIEGTFNGKGFGGVPYIEIQKSDGKILKVIHGK